jgi:LacI family transcriptional regulator
VIRGIRAYGIQKNDWTFRNGLPDMQIIPYLRDWKPHGIIANLFSNDVAKAVVRLRKPLVDTACALEGLKTPTVDVDQEAVGRLAAEYLVKRGFTHFGFFGSTHAFYSKLREIGFRNALEQFGYSVSSCHGEYLCQVLNATSWKQLDQDIDKWLRQLPKPVAIFACNDVPARNLADRCCQLGLHIPNQVALLGVDDDELECPLTSPPLSSIAIPAERIGYEAAKLLDQMMSGDPAPAAPVFLQPLGVVTRQSTDTMVIEDPIVLAALTYIDRHATRPITVGKVVHEVGCGRRDLERRFRLILNRSVLDQIRWVRIDRAKNILLCTDLAMPAVAAQAGFSNAQRFAIVFKQLTGMAPTTYRRQAKIR